jgi:heme exporter protein D
MLWSTVVVTAIVLAATIYCVQQMRQKLKILNQRENNQRCDNCVGGCKK